MDISANSSRVPKGVPQILTNLCEPTSSRYGSHRLSQEKNRKSQKKIPVGGKQPKHAATHPLLGVSHASNVDTILENSGAIFTPLSDLGAVRLTAPANNSHPNVDMAELDGMSSPAQSRTPPPILSSDATSRTPAALRVPAGATSSTSTRPAPLSIDSGTIISSHNPRVWQIAKAGGAIPRSPSASHTQSATGSKSTA